MFVLVACPENSIVDSQELYKPVVTPFEMEIACIRYSLFGRCVCIMYTSHVLCFVCRSREWSGEVSTNYQELLPGELEAVVCLSFIGFTYVLYTHNYCQELHSMYQWTRMMMKQRYVWFE